MANHTTVSSRALFPLTLLALAFATTRCNNADCESLRDELMAQKLSWQDCTRDEECIKVGGNQGDCTGIMSCDFAVNAVHRLTAERRVASLPEESQDCMQCSSPNCVVGKRAFCEPVSRKCMVVTEIVEPEAPTTTNSGGSGTGGTAPAVP